MVVISNLQQELGFRMGDPLALLNKLMIQQASSDDSDHLGF